MSFDKFHLSRDEPYPDCPRCNGDTASVPGRFNIATNRSKAIDYAQSMVESEYGQTNMQDNLREGDIAAAKPAEPTKAEAEAFARAIAQEQQNAIQSPDGPPPQPMGGFWQQTEGGIPATIGPAAAEARAHGLDPVSLVEKGAAAGATGPGGVKLNVIARGAA